ncbi:MAG: cobalamin biosynthesis bifunctional protein CbiET [Zetaproteobacteria bacterium]|nr:cobalamin biosynthesis bifunctional protein CbiET [Pseudobdellovibrionaceae bacterium]
MTHSVKSITVIGIGDDGCSGLSSKAHGAVTRAQVLVGGRRHLEFFPQFDGELICYQDGWKTAMDRLVELSGENNIAVLASGDPLFFGVGQLLVKKVGAEYLEFIPQPTSIQWAFARIGERWDDAGVVSVHGRSMGGFVSRLRYQDKVAVFTDEEHSPARIAARMLEYSENHWDAVVCENIGGYDERIRSFSLDELAAAQDISSLNVLILKRQPNEPVKPMIGFLPEEEFAKRVPKKGLITKREVRLLSLGFMRIKSDSVIWDLGAGSGSVAIEAGRLAYNGKVFAVEVDPEGVGICEENVRRHGCDHVDVIAGRAPEVFPELDDPDCVFIGGSKGSLREMISQSWQRLSLGGSLVVNAVTLENVIEAKEGFKEVGVVPELVQVQVSRGKPLAGKYTKYEALNPIHIFAATKEVAEK